MKNLFQQKFKKFKQHTIIFKNFYEINWSTLLKILFSIFCLVIIWASKYFIKKSIYKLFGAESLLNKESHLEKILELLIITEAQNSELIKNIQEKQVLTEKLIDRLFYQIDNMNNSISNISQSGSLDISDIIISTILTTVVGLAVSASFNYFFGSSTKSIKNDLEKNMTEIRSELNDIRQFQRIDNWELRKQNETSNIYFDESYKFIYTIYNFMGITRMDVSDNFNFEEKKSNSQPNSPLIIEDYD